MGQTSLNAVDTSYSLAECPKYPYAYEYDMVMCVLYLSGHIFIIIGVNKPDCSCCVKKYTSVLEKSQ